MIGLNTLIPEIPSTVKDKVTPHEIDIENSSESDIVKRGEILSPV